MKEIIAHEMKYEGENVTSNIDVINYSDEYFEEYRNVYEECFYEMRTALELYPINGCDTREQLADKKSDIFLLLKNSELIGSVAIYKKEIDDLVVAKKYQSQGYGKQLLFFAINYMQRNRIEPITLLVTDWNKNALNLYSNNGFKCIKTEKIIYPD